MMMNHISFINQNNYLVNLNINKQLSIDFVMLKEELSLNDLIEMESGVSRVNKKESDLLNKDLLEKKKSPIHGFGVHPADRRSREGWPRPITWH